MLSPVSQDPEHFTASASRAAFRIPRSDRRAVIDIGTNSVKLLVADVFPAAVEPIWEGSEQTRLGRGFYDDHRLRPEAIADTAKAVAHFTAIAQKQGASHLRVIATSAARDAENANELLAAVRAASGVTIEVISGEQEADWVFQGVLTNDSLSNQTVLLLDVGGGSTEFILGNADCAIFRDSFKLGTVRLLESASLSDPPTPAELANLRAQLRAFLECEVRPRLAPHLDQLLPARPCLVGTGGTTSILARLELQLADYDRERIEATRFTAARLRWHVERLWHQPLAKRRELPGLPPTRADVILFGAAIYEAVMEAFGLAELRVSTRGLRFAAVRP